MELDKKIIECLVNELLIDYLNHYETNFGEFCKFELGDILSSGNYVSKGISTAQMQDNVMNLFKLIIVDAAANTLGKLDGINLTKQAAGHFKLTASGNQLQGKLKKEFIEKSKDIVELTNFDLEYIGTIPNGNQDAEFST